MKSVLGMDTITDCPLPLIQWMIPVDRDELASRPFPTFLRAADCGCSGRCSRVPRRTHDESLVTRGSRRPELLGFEKGPTFAN